MNLCVVGTGYVGLVTGTVFADLGYSVCCTDKDESKIEMLNAGRMPIYEPGLEEMVQRNVGDGRLCFSSDVAESVSQSDIVFLAVGTPPGEDGYADLTAIREVAVTIAQHLYSYKVIVNKSTVPVGTARMVRDLVTANRVRSDVDFDVVSNPEFLREGNAIQDTLQPDRIIIGASNQKSAMSLVELYTPLERPIVVTDPSSAEMVKYASNAFLATKISFVNAIANICELVGADILQVSKGVGLDKRIGSAFLNAGLGWGGSCFGKDTSCLIATADRAGYDFELLKAVVSVNEEQPRRFVDKILETMGGVDGKTIAVLGLAFKPNTDDLRDGKSLEIVSQLSSAGARVRAYDPVAMDNARKLLPDLMYCASAYEAADGADALVLVTEWKEFKFLDLDRLRDMMKSPVIFDGRNVLNPERVRSKGFVYHCVGRPASGPGECGQR
ncbi:MAG: UDP-glucose/GDP-mannose dehydrogenase family protein [Armatimonadetes bacterium]|nr:UDP-glucose/GDP-mannose dehydrogenase family protein [Armatimonadota bacterium]